MKDRILGYLIKNMGQYVSGETLCSELNCSRTAVWKYIGMLRLQGTDIDASTRKGYKLASLPNYLCSEAIRHSMAKGGFWRRVIILDTVDSTNNYIKSLHLSDGPDRTAVFAGEQTNGRGRMDRSWFSPKGGLYMSMLFRPTLPSNELLTMKLLFPVAVCEAIKDVSRLDCGIKWPNDIIYKGCKIGGVLTESISEFGGNSICVSGVGINISEDVSQIKGDLAPFAATIPEFTEMPVNVNLLASAVLNRVAQLTHLESSEIHAKYASKCVTVGSEVKVLFGNQRIEARAEEISMDGSLILRLPDGNSKSVYYGEVSVSGIMGYV